MIVPQFISCNMVYIGNFTLPKSWIMSLFFHISCECIEVPFECKSNVVFVSRILAARSDLPPIPGKPVMLKLYELPFILSGQPQTNRRRSCISNQLYLRDLYPFKRFSRHSMVGLLRSHREPLLEQITPRLHQGDVGQSVCGFEANRQNHLDDRGGVELGKGFGRGGHVCGEPVVRGETSIPTMLAPEPAHRARRRRGRDLNPRGGFQPPTRLAGERLRPLGHLSRRSFTLAEGRREWDSNPRDPLPGPPVFKTSAFVRSAIPPRTGLHGSKTANRASPPPAGVTAAPASGKETAFP